MKTIVIGIDGLEYYLVEALNLKNLMQKRYDRLLIPKEFYIESEDVPYTPLIWGTILTGKSPMEHGARSLWVYRNRLLERIRWLPPLRWIKGKRSMLKKLGFSPQREGFRISGKTFLDRFESSIAINVPGVNLWDDVNRRIVTLIEEGNLNTLYFVLEKYMLDVFHSFQRELNKVDFEIAMMYINSLDYIGHLCWGKCFDKVIRLYRKADTELYKLFKNVSYDVSLILSDHGMKKDKKGIMGKHSSYMFYSLNIDYKFHSIYDIPNRLLEWASSK